MTVATPPEPRTARGPEDAPRDGGHHGWQPRGALGCPPPARAPQRADPAPRGPRPHGERASRASSHRYRPYSALAGPPVTATLPGGADASVATTCERSHNHRSLVVDRPTAHVYPPALRCLPGQMLRGDVDDRGYEPAGKPSAGTAATSAGTCLRPGTIARVGSSRHDPVLRSSCVPRRCGKSPGRRLRHLHCGRRAHGYRVYRVRLHDTPSSQTARQSCGRNRSSGLPPPGVLRHEGDQQRYTPPRPDLWWFAARRPGCCGAPVARWMVTACLPRWRPAVAKDVR